MFFDIWRNYLRRMREATAENPGKRNYLLLRPYPQVCLHRTIKYMSCGCTPSDSRVPSSYQSHGKLFQSLKMGLILEKIPDRCIKQLKIKN